MPTKLTDLPDDLIKHIFKDFTNDTHRQISKTCKRFHSIVDITWWKNRFTKTNPDHCEIKGTWQQKFLINQDVSKLFSFKLTYTNNVKWTLSYFRCYPDGKVYRNAFWSTFCSFVVLLPFTRILKTRLPTLNENKLILLNGTLAVAVSTFFQYVFFKYDIVINSYKYIYKVKYYKDIALHLTRFALRWRRVLSFKQMMGFTRFYYQKI